MSAIRRFMSYPQHRPMICKVDTSQGNGLPNYIIPTITANFILRVDGGAPVVYTNATRPLISLLPDSVHELEIDIINGLYTHGSEHGAEVLDLSKLIEISQFGSRNLISRREFQLCNNLIINSTDTPRIDGDMTSSFQGIRQISSESINYWDFSKATHLQDAFRAMQLPLLGSININAASVSTAIGMMRGISDINNPIENIEIRLILPNMTSASDIMRTTQLNNVKIVMQTPLNQNLQWAFSNHNGNIDLTEVDISSVSLNTNWITQAINTDKVDAMLVAWSELQTMQSGVDWNLRGSVVTSIGKAAIDDMELRHGCTFSNYSQI